MVSVLETFDTEVNPGSKYSRRIEGLPRETLQRVVEFVVIDRSVIFPALYYWLASYPEHFMRIYEPAASACLIGYVSMASSVNDRKCIFNLIIIQGIEGNLKH